MACVRPYLSAEGDKICILNLQLDMALISYLKTVQDPQNQADFINWY